MGPTCVSKEWKRCQNSPIRGLVQCVGAPEWTLDFLCICPSFIHLTFTKYFVQTSVRLRKLWSLTSLQSALATQSVESTQIAPWGSSAAGDCLILVSAAGYCLILGSAVGGCRILGFVAGDCLILGSAAGDCRILGSAAGDCPYSRLCCR
jgi:hypothetical protein